MRVLFFGTFDESKHPRVRVLREGLRSHVGSVQTCNVPLRFSTAQRVSAASQPWRLAALAGRIIICWLSLLWQSRNHRADVVVVGYLGHFDVHLARARYPGAVIVLDHLVSIEGTIRDRGLDKRKTIVSLARFVDRFALRRADIVVVDTEEQLEHVPEHRQDRCVVVPVGATCDWADFRRPPRTDHRDDQAGPSEPDRLSVVFYGLFTPLHGAVTIAEAIRLLGDTPIDWTLIGKGQALDAARSIIGSNAAVNWIDWLDESELRRVVAEHDVCLGIFGTTPKALRVIPNKVYQGAMAGCAVVTSDTPPQRRTLATTALLVPPGDAQALAEALRRLAKDPAKVALLRQQAGNLADRHFGPAAVTEELSRRLGSPS